MIPSPVPQSEWLAILDRKSPQTRGDCPRSIRKSPPAAAGGLRADVDPGKLAFLLYLGFLCPGSISRETRLVVPFYDKIVTS